MADKYLVPCDCGESVAAAVNQAGAEVVCQCGTTLKVPTLRQLRKLPREQDTESTAKQSGEWTPRHSTALAGVMTTVALLLWGVWLWAKQPETPQFDQMYRDVIAGDAKMMLEKGTAAQFWRHWIITSPQLIENGFEEIVMPQEKGYRDYLQQYRTQMYAVLSAAGIAALITVVAWLAWPSAGTRPSR